MNWEEALLMHLIQIKGTTCLKFGSLSIQSIISVSDSSNVKVTVKFKIYRTWGTLGTPSSLGGGPSTVIETMFSPLRSTSPSTLFSSLSADFADFGFSFLWRIYCEKSENSTQ